MTEQELAELTAGVHVFYTGRYAERFPDQPMRYLGLCDCARYCAELARVLSGRAREPRAVLGDGWMPTDRAYGELCHVSPAHLRVATADEVRAANLDPWRVHLPAGQEGPS
jgi:hypothetical protein